MIILRRKGWTESVLCMLKKRNALKTLVRKAEEKKRLGSPWLRLENRIKMDLQRNRF
jgi:hypothetical protein